MARTSLKALMIAACAALACAGLAAGETGAADSSSSAPEATAPAPEANAQRSATQPQKSAGEFQGWLINTSDSTWQKRWAASFETLPDVQQVNSVRRGEHIYTLIFMTNPTLDAIDEADVRCDLRVTAPDGTRPVQSTDLDCLHGRLNGDPAKFWLSHHILEFVSEPTDPVGTWHVDVTLHDMPRDITLKLRTSFEVLEAT